MKGWWPSPSPPKPILPTLDRFGEKDQNKWRQLTKLCFICFVFFVQIFSNHQIQIHCCLPSIWKSILNENFQDWFISKLLFQMSYHYLKINKLNRPLIFKIPHFILQSKIIIINIGPWEAYLHLFWSF